jgi:UDP:flavonoid glycosyltransferase YjiC (YdhE family)
VAKILFAWELGGEFGHALACAALARALHARGHEIAFAFREMRPLSVLPEAKAYAIFQAPRHPREGAVHAPASLAEILYGCGYSTPEDLGTLLDGWLAILREWKPDLVICDFAPTALLAARLEGLTRVSFGNGFFTPPRLDPLPAFRFDEPIAPQRLRDSNDRVLAIVNAALAARGAAPLTRLAEQFETAEDFLCTFPELDHYGSRPASGYWGPRFRFDRGREMRWPKGAGKRVFAYIKRNGPHVDAFIEQLARGPARSIAYIPELDATRRARLASPYCAVADRPVRLDGLIKECDLLICHGGEMATGALMHGVPQLLAPQHYEQYLTAKRLELVGSGGWIGPQVPAQQVARVIARMLGEPAFRARAHAYARRYPAFSSEEQRRRILRRIEEIVAPRSILSRSPVPGAPE